jgi:PIN domain nuclease of toxin-antitoxin system
VRLLLDTHVLLWWRQKSRRLGARPTDLIASAPEVYVSAASAWEVVIKTALGRLSLDDLFETHVVAAGFDPLPISFAHAAEVGRLPPLHADPFDRMLVAQARVEGLTLVTHDKTLARYDVPTILV